MISRMHLTVLLFTASLIWGTLLIIDGFAVTLYCLKPISIVVGILIFLLSFFEKWGWGISYLHPWFVLVPDMRGTWKGTLLSTWQNDLTQEPIPIESYLVIRQTYSTISIRLITKESISTLLTGSIIRSNDGIYEIVGVYQNTPKILIREKSPIHYGGILLAIEGNPPSYLEGHYWTDRETKGELRFKKFSRTTYENFTQASLATHD